MQFSLAVIASAALSLVSAVNLTNTVYNDITAGQPYSIGWGGASGPVTLTLKNGGANNLQTVSTIASGLTTSPFIWNVPSTLPADTYAIEIQDSTGTNFGPQFQLLGATVSASTSGTVSATGSSSTSLATVKSTSSAATTASSASTTPTSSSSNSTASHSSASQTSSGISTAASKTSSSPSSSSSVPSTNSGAEFASPLALVFLTFAAMFTLN